MGRDAAPPGPRRRGGRPLRRLRRRPPLVRHHHEAWDGTGYPDGLAGEAIPLGARILAVADTFDALTSDRPYRDGLAVEAALQILENGAGRQWDARIVAALADALREAPQAVPLGGAPQPAVERIPVPVHTAPAVEIVPAKLLTPGSLAVPIAESADAAR